MGRIGLIIFAGLLLGACTAQDNVIAPREGAAAPSATQNRSLPPPREPPGRLSPPPRDIPRRPSPPPGDVVYFRLDPDHDKVDKYCGAWDRSYVAEPVDIPQGEQRVLTLALHALSREVWDVQPSQIEDVHIVDGRAVIDLRSTHGIGMASTTCGGVGFTGSLLRTAFQFDSVREAEMRIRGSCRRWGNFMQSARCDVHTR